MRTRLPARLSILVLAFALAAAPALAAGEGTPAGNPGRRLENVERALEAERLQGQQLRRRAAALEQELERLRLDLVAQARTIQGIEHEAAVFEARLSDLEAVARDKSDMLARQRDQFARVLGALQRLARYPPEALIAEPASPADTVRGAIVLRAAVPEIERRAGRLRQDLDGLAAARAEIETRRARLAALATSLEAERRRLDELLARKSGLKRETDAESRKAEARARTLAEEAATLKDLLDRLEEERRLREEQPYRQGEELRTRKEETEAPAKPKARLGPATRTPPAGAPPSSAGKPIETARGKLPFPAVGRVVAQYGQALDTGLARKGIEIETRAGAQVVASHDGRVAFAGPFRGYGLLLIIEHGDGYHTLLSGMAEIAGLIGQSVVAGEPVGVMGRPDGAKPVLYLELRRGGQPINPLPWLAARENKVSG